MSEDLRGLISYIYSIESRGGDYNIVHTGIPKDLRPAKPLTQMTVGEVLAWQDEIDPFVNSEAAGAMQIMPDTLRGLIDQGKVDPNAMFDPDTQDAITVALMEGRGLRRWQAGEMSTEEFGNQLAMEWAGLPLLAPTYKGDKLLERGRAYYGGDGMNPSHGLTSPEALEAALANPASYDPSQWRMTRSTQGGGTWEPGVGIQRRGIAEGQMGQYESTGAGVTYDYPWLGRAQLETSYRNQLALPGGDPGIPALPSLPQANYGTRTGEGGGADLGATWSRVFADEWADSFLVQGTKDWWATRNSTHDMSFDPITTAVDEGGYSQDEILFLGAAENRMDYDRLKRQIDNQRARDYRREVYDGWVAPLLGGMLNPDSLISMGVPGGVIVSGMRRAGVNAARSAAAGALMSGASEAALEAGRSRFDSQANGMDSLIRVGMATAIGGVFSAAVAGAVTPAARRGLAERAAVELANARGLGKTTATIDIGRGQKATVVFDNDEMVAVAPEGAVPRARTARIVDVDGRPVLAVVDPEDAARGVYRVRDRIVVSAQRLAERVRSGDVPEGVTSTNELMEYEIGRVAAFTRKLREFFKKEDGGVGPDGEADDAAPWVTVDEAGNVVVDRDRLARAMNGAGVVRLGDGVNGKVTPIEVEASVFGEDLDFLEAAVRAAHDFAMRARDDGEFRDMVATIFGGRSRLESAEPEAVVRARAQARAEAEAAAEDHLRKWRRENNKILQDARMEAFARIMDSPYKRIHRNALHGFTRDVVDLLAADGGFLRGADGKGQNLGPSVYSRAKTWLGMVDRLYRKERELYARYLGMESNPGVLGVNLSDFKRKRMDGSKAIPMREWRRMVTRAHITGVPSDIPEVNEMAASLKGVLDEYGIVADEYGVISGQKTMQRKAKRLQEIIDMTKDEAKREAMQRDLDQLEEMIAQSEADPGEDYFSRVWSRKAILANREAFKERIVKPWMVQQPYVWMWEPGKDELRRGLQELRDQGAPQERIDAMQKRLDKAEDRGGFRKIETSNNMADIDARAEQMIATILDEADPGDLSTLREAHRPTFGRHRQFNIPNRMLLKDGPEGNGIADFIETDYLLVQRIYADRMGPAIELARTFGRPIDGVSGVDGWENALKQAREAEEMAFIEKHSATYGEQIEAARKAEYDARKAEIENAPSRLEAAEEDLTRVGGLFARAKERADLAGMTDEQADEWLAKAEERGRAAWLKKTVGQEQTEALERAGETFVAGVVKAAQRTFKEVRLDEGGKARAVDALAPAQLELDRARGLRNYHLRLVNMTADEAESDALEQAADLPVLPIIEAAGGPKFSDHWAPIERDLLHLKDRVSNRVIRNPERWDNRTATVLKDYSRLAFMGLAGLNAIQEFGMLVNRHGATKAFRAAFMRVDAEMASAMQAGKLEMQKAGAILDVAMGGALASFAETGMDATYGSTAERWIRTASNRYFNWNGLAPITARFKEMDAMIRVNDTLEKIDRVYQGTASTEDIADLSRFGISVETAKRIWKEPIQTNDGGYWLANTDQWGDEDLVRTFRAAIAQGNENTVLMATAADKPIIVDGTAYIRKGGAADKYAKKLGLREVGDYWQVQSGLMSLPFSFWNYGIAATNKILISGVDEASGQKLAGIATMIGMGYMIAQLRTDQGQWESLSVGDRVAKAVDQSGVVGLLGTYANLFQGASLATMGVNPLPFERTRGMRNPSMADMAEQFAGAGPSAVANLIRGVAGGGLEEARWGLPFANMIGTGWLWEGLIDGLNRRQAGLDG